MAVSNQEIIYTVKAETGEIEKALATVSKDAEKTADSIDDVGKSMNETGDATSILTNKLDNLTGGAVSGFKNAATSTKSFITGLKLTRAAIIATGIGALVVGVVALVQQFSKTEEGSRKLQKALAPLRAVIDVLQQKISTLGGAIFKLFSGDFRGAADDFTRALSNQNNEYQRQIDLYRELIDREQALEDARIRQTVATAKTRAEIKELNLVAEDLTKSIDEREAAAERAGQLERDLFEERKRIAEEELAIAQARLESSNTTTANCKRLSTTSSTPSEPRACVNNKNKSTSCGRPTRNCKRAGFR
jgi:peptidoglycan hydrolase CwlO-like protein